MTAATRPPSTRTTHPPRSRPPCRPGRRAASSATKVPAWAATRPGRRARPRPRDRSSTRSVKAANSSWGPGAPTGHRDARPRASPGRRSRSRRGCDPSSTGSSAHRRSGHHHRRRQAQDPCDDLARPVAPAAGRRSPRRPRSVPAARRQRPRLASAERRQRRVGLPGEAVLDVPRRLAVTTTTAPGHGGPPLRVRPVEAVRRARSGRRRARCRAAPRAPRRPRRGAARPGPCPRRGGPGPFLESGVGDRAPFDVLAQVLTPRADGERLQERARGRRRPGRRPTGRHRCGAGPGRGRASRQESRTSGPAPATSR